MRNSSKRASSGNVSSSALLAGLLTAGALHPAFGQTQAAAETTEVPLEAVLVTASRVAREGFDAPTPVAVLGEAELQQRAASNVLISLNEMPQFRPTQVPGATTFQANADLRGLGRSRTLVLLDGRRFVPSASPNGIVVDMNLIPAGMVKRVEVVTGGASAAWGSDAVAGVVNLILDTEFNGFKTDVSYGAGMQEGDMEETSISLVAGGEFGEAGHILVGGQYVTDEGQNDPFTRDWFRREVGLSSYPASGRPAGQPSRLYLDRTRSAVQTVGGLIISPGPLRGTQFGVDGAISQFDFGQVVGSNAIGGTPVNPADPKDRNTILGNPLKGGYDRYSVLARIDYEFAAGVRTYAEVNLAKSGGDVPSVTQARRFDPAAPIVIRRDNPFIPESIAAIMDDNGLASFQLGRFNSDFDNTSLVSQNQTERFVIGASGALPGDWSWDGYVQFGNNRYDQTTRNFSINSRFFKAVDAVRNASGEIVCRVNQLSVVDPFCRPLNVLGIGVASQDAIDYQQADMIMDEEYSQRVAALNVQGEPFSTWAGPVSTALGIEYREESVVVHSDPISQDVDFFFGNYQPFSGKLDVREGYFETIVPLLAGVTAAKSLDLNGAVRRTDYSTSGGVTTWKAGITYAPVDELKFRGTRSRDIRAPDLSELFGFSYVTTTIRHPYTGILGPTRTATTGNAELTPEIADTTTVGFVYEPTWLDGLHVSIDYFDIEIKDTLATFPAQTVVDECARELDSGASGMFCDQLTYRGTPGAGFIIDQIALLPVNTASLETNGVDIELAYKRPFLLGNLGLSLFGTFTDTLLTKQGTLVREDAGRVSGGFFGVPKWRATGTISYHTERLSSALQIQYIKGGILDPTLIGPDNPAYSPSLPNSVNINSVGDEYYLNLSTSYVLRDDGDSQIQVYGVVNNLLDTDPPNGGAGVGNYYDRFGRVLKLGARVKF